ncbi:MAG: hypothetical protein ACKO0Z_09720 [Betaproteobacteria bacterium]
MIKRTQANFRIDDEDQRMVQEMRQTVLTIEGKVPTETDIWRMALREFYDSHRKRGRK